MEGETLKRNEGKNNSKSTCEETDKNKKNNKSKQFFRVN